MSRFELLAPAGSPEALRAAVNAGADAVYIGGSAFGARAYADNADTEALIDCIRFCHLRGKKLYLTVNTLFKEDELENRLFSFLRPYYEAGLDAVIVQDMGAVDYIASHFPGLPIHLSTQTAITMAEGTFSLAEKYPCISRVVPARELSLKEIERFRRDSSMELEIFIHGALCYCYSGQCLMSSMIGGRSGNRGRCAQPCRKLYDGRYLLSPKDQCLLSVLHELLDIGIDSLKIEGRMKSPEYTAGVVSVYRKYIDKYEELGSAGYKKWLAHNDAMLKSDMTALQDLYNRGGFNSGYLKQHNGPDMMTFDRPNHSGVEVGTVTAVNGREAVIRFSDTVNAQDVLEIRADNEAASSNTARPDKSETSQAEKSARAVFEYTVKDCFKSGSVTSCITMKDRRAAVGMKVFRIRNNSLLNEIREKYIEKDSKVPVNIVFYGHEGESAKLELSCDPLNTSFCVAGSIVEAAKKAPSDEASVSKQLCKLGETSFASENMQIDIGSNVFIPSGELNRLRREAVEGLELAILAQSERETPEEIDAPVIAGGRAENTSVIYSVWNEEAFSAVLDAATEQAGFEVYYNISDLDTAVIDRIHNMLQNCYDLKSNGTEAGRDVSVCSSGLFIGLPYICRSAVYDKLKNFVAEIHEKYPEVGFIARTQEEMHLLKSKGLYYRTDYNLYVMNNRAKRRYDAPFTLPLELNRDELWNIADENAEMIVYGFQPVMFSAQCVYRNKFAACKNSGHDYTAITDEFGHDFRCVQDCEFCYNIIYNQAALDLTDSIDRIEDLELRAIRYDFTFESPDAIRDIIRGTSSHKTEYTTHGHFLRGIQ